MSRFQTAGFEISGRVAHMQALQAVVKLTVAVSNRVPAADTPNAWRPASTEVFGLSIEDPGLRDYAIQSVAIGDLVIVKGKLSSTHFSSGQATKPSSGLRLIVTSIVAIPKRQADRLDTIPPFAEEPPRSGIPPF